MTPPGDEGAQVDPLLTNGAVKTASVPTAAVPEEAESSHNSITVTSHIPNAAEETRSSVSFGRSYT